MEARVATQTALESTMLRGLKVALKERIGQALKDLDGGIDELERKEAMIRCLAPALRGREEIEWLLKLPTESTERETFANQLANCVASISQLNDGAPKDDPFAVRMWRVADHYCQARKALSIDDVEEVKAQIVAGNAALTEGTGESDLSLQERAANEIKQMKGWIEEKELAEWLLRHVSPAVRTDQELEDLLNLVTDHPDKKLFESQLSESAKAIFARYQAPCGSPCFADEAWRIAHNFSEAAGAMPKLHHKLVVLDYLGRAYDDVWHVIRQALGSGIYRYEAGLSNYAP